MEYQLPQGRDRSIVVTCIKCGVNIARIEIKNIFKLGMYICEGCFVKLDRPLPKEPLK